MALLTCADKRSRLHVNHRFHDAGTQYTENCAIYPPETPTRYPIDFTATVDATPQISAGVWTLEAGRHEPVKAQIDTRYQTDACVNMSYFPNKQFAADCQKSVANSYVYASAPTARRDALESTRAFPNHHDGRLPVYCFVGASHARDVGGAFVTDVANRSLATMHYLRAEHIRAVASVIEGLSTNTTKDYHSGVVVSHCDFVVVHIGQWDLGEIHPARSPYPTTSPSCLRLRLIPWCPSGAHILREAVLEFIVCWNGWIVCDAHRSLSAFCSSPVSQRVQKADGHRTIHGGNILRIPLVV